MSDPKRLFDEGGSLAREILGSADRDRPSDEARRKAALVLGLPLAAAAATASTTTSASSASLGAPSLPAAIAAKGVAMKWVLAAVVAASAATGTLLVNPAPRPTAPTPIQSSAPVPVPIPMSAPIVEEAPPPAPPPPVVSKRLVATPKKPMALAPPELPAKLDLAGEVALLDRAKLALAAGEPAAALTVLDTYDHSGAESLIPEAQALRIDALVASHDPAAARAAAIAFIARFPSHRLSLRYRALAEAP